MNLIDKIVKILQNKGFVVKNPYADIMTENAIDSINFIEMIVELENEFVISIPDEFLTLDSLNTVEKISNIIKDLLYKDEDFNNE